MGATGAAFLKPQGEVGEYKNFLESLEKLFVAPMQQLIHTNSCYTQQQEGLENSVKILKHFFEKVKIKLVN